MEKINSMHNKYVLFHIQHISITAIKMVHDQGGLKHQWQSVWGEMEEIDSNMR